MLSKRRPSSTDFNFGKKKNSHGAKSVQLTGWGNSHLNFNTKVHNFVKISYSICIFLFQRLSSSAQLSPQRQKGRSHVDFVSKHAGAAR